MSECNRCGYCCMHSTFTLCTLTKESEREQLEMGRWLSYHGCRMYKSEENGVAKLHVCVPITCQYLRCNPDGVYECAIYEKRPEICKKYECKRSKKEGGERVWQHQQLLGTE